MYVYYRLTYCRKASHAVNFAFILKSVNKTRLITSISSEAQLKVELKIMNEDEQKSLTPFYSDKMFLHLFLLSSNLQTDEHNIYFM